MKKSNIILTLIFTTLSMSALALAPLSDSPVEFEKTQDHQVNIKIDKTILGAEVFVYNASGELVTIDRLTKKSLVIDLHHVKSGTYVIMVKKNQFSEEFTYNKSEELSMASR